MQQQTRVLRELEEHVVAIVGGSVLASQEPACKERVRVVAVQLQCTARQLSVEIRLVNTLPSGHIQRATYF